MCGKVMTNQVIDTDMIVQFDDDWRGLNCGGTSFQFNSVNKGRYRKHSLRLSQNL